MPKPKLTPMQIRFAEEYAVDLNAKAAAIRAGYAPARAKQFGYRLLQHEHISELVSAEIKARSKRTHITQDLMLLHLWQLANANPNELTEFRRGSCRHCWGEGFRKQRTAAEFEADRTTHEDAVSKNLKTGDFNPEGGIGYDFSRAPNRKCPQCHGQGLGSVFIKDTRDLSEDARLLYAGVRHTKEGIEVKTNSQDKARELIYRHLGMDVQRHEHSGPDGGPIRTASEPDLTALDDDDLATLAKLLEKATPAGGGQEGD